jgi:tetratricopeptide (TPR) repeat protein
VTQNIREIWDFSDACGSEIRFRTAAERSTEPERTAYLTQVARALGLQEHYDAGHTLLDSLAADQAEAQTRIALERGRLLRSAGDLTGALPHFVAAAECAGSAGLEDLHLDALHMLALLEESPAGQIAANLAALDAARAATDPVVRTWDAPLLNNLGCALVDAGRPEEALDTFEEALAARRVRGGEREIQIARWMVAWALRLNGRNSEALSAQRRLKADLVAAGIDDPYVDEEIAALESLISGVNDPLDP